MRNLVVVGLVGAAALVAVGFTGACGAPPAAQPRSPAAPVAEAVQPAAAPGPTAPASHAEPPAPVPSAARTEPARAPLAVPRAALLTSADPAVRARVLAAGTSSTMPSGKSPSLVRGLAFGMSAEEASKSVEPDKWTSMGAAKARVRVSQESGVNMIELVYADEAAAARAVAPWGKPFDGDSRFRWSVWTNGAAGIRAVLMPGEDGHKRTRVELLPFRPLAELMADGGELAFEGMHLLDVDPSRLKSLPRARDDIQMLPVELSSGSIPLRLEAKGYTVGIDATYHHPLEGEVRKMLVAHWGAAQEEPREPPSQKSCIRFAPRAGVRARACLLLTQWQITITRSD